MFTGIVERPGEVAEAIDRPGGRRLVVRPLEGPSFPPWEPLEAGESIAIDGVCLTALPASADGALAAFDVVPETLSRTTLGRLRAGHRVNLERSLRVGERLGGHFVTGHIDGMGEVLLRRPEGDQVLFRIGAPPPLIAQTIPKGSVAVDGVALTIIDVDRQGGWFSFAAIPHTLEITSLGERGVGDQVNLETDALGKWVLHGLREVLGPEGRLPGA